MMGACKRASRISESPQQRREAARVGLELLAFVVCAAGSCTAAGDYEPTLVSTDPAATGVPGSRPPTAPGQAPANIPTGTPSGRDPGTAGAPVGLFPGDVADESVGGTSGAEAIAGARDAGGDASSAGDGGDAASSARDAGGSAGDAGVPARELDASTPPTAVDAGPPPGEHDAAAPPPSAPEPCPGVVFEGSCYELFDELLPWSEAEARCVAWGGHLASVESLEEDALLGAWPALLGVPLLDGSGLWLGGTDALRDGNFRWWDDRPLGFTGWAPDQPNNGPGVDCIQKRNDATQRWYDRRCTDGHRYVCERPQ